MKVLVIGFTTEKGQKVSEFLIHKGAVVFVADNRVGQPVREIQGIARIFTLNPQHRDSMWLMLEVAKPEVLVYCSSNNGDYSVFLNTLLIAIKNGVSKIVLIVNENGKKIETLADLETVAMTEVLRIVSKKNLFEWLVVYPTDNLLKEVKKFLLKEE